MCWLCNVRSLQFAEEERLAAAGEADAGAQAPATAGDAHDVASPSRLTAANRSAPAPADHTIATPPQPPREA